MVTRKTMWDLAEALEVALDKFTKENPDLKVTSRMDMEDHKVLLIVKSVEAEEEK